MNVCPIGAITWQQKEGCITVDHKRCIGCSACTTACPWMMATVNTESKKSSKCVLCGECKRLPNRGVKNYRVEDITGVNLAKEIMANGWTGNILRVNLTTGNITLEDSSKFKSFVGGMGFGYKIMYDEVPPGTKPFDEANKLVFATGPLTGSGAPCSSRVNITSLSTFTKGNLVVDAHMGGFFAAQMKFAGYDVIIIEGKAKITGMAED